MKMTKIDALNIALSTLTADSYDVKYDVLLSDGTSTIRTETFTQQEVQEVIEKMIAQLSKPRKTSDASKEKAKIKRANARAELMTQVLPIIREAIADGGTAKEIFERCADDLPDDFTSAKVQYILLHEMKDEVEKIEQKGKPNVYKMKG